jgi:hypothetical protein
MPTNISTFTSTMEEGVTTSERLNMKFYEYVQEQKKTNSAYFDTRCALSQDFIKLSIFASEMSLYPLMNEIKRRETSPVKSNLNVDFKYDQSRTYEFEFEGRNHTFNIIKSNSEAFLPIILTLHDPTKNLLNFIESHIKHSAWYHVKEIEFTFDFENDDEKFIHYFIKNHLAIKWRGKSFHHPSDTDYFANIRFAKGKGARLYGKELSGNKQDVTEVTRLEILLKRPILYRSGITSLSDVINMKTEIITKYFSFKEFNYRLYKKRLLENKSTLDQIELYFNQVKEKISNGFLYDLNSAIVEQYRKYPSDGFLVNHSFQSHFINQIHGKSFLNRDSFMVSTGLMDDKIFDADTMSLFK